MYCTNCGNKLKENTNFCTRCGKRIKTVTNQNIIIESKAKLPEDEIKLIESQKKKGSKPKENILLSLSIIIIFLLCLISILIISLATNNKKLDYIVNQETEIVPKATKTEPIIDGFKLFDYEYKLYDPLSKYLSSDWELNNNYNNIDTETETINKIPSRQLTLKNKNYEKIEITVYLSKYESKDTILKDSKVVGVKLNLYENLKETYFEIGDLTKGDRVDKVIKKFSNPKENNIYKPAYSSNTIYNYTSNDYELLLAIDNNNELSGFKYIKRENNYK